jgi:hypothetical protein
VNIVKTGAYQSCHAMGTPGTRTMYQLERGKENRPKAVKIQLRPDPRAR